MLITIGNSNPQSFGAPTEGPAVTTCGVTDAQDEAGNYLATYETGSDVAAIKDHLFDNQGLQTHLPGNGLIVDITRSFSEQGSGRPTFVSVDPQGRDPENAADLERFLAEFWRCDRGIPATLEDTHFTVNGPPGVGPVAEIEAAPEGA